MRILLLCFLLTPLTIFSQDFNESVISQSVLEKIAEKPEAYQPILILLENQVNFSQLVQNFDENRISVNERPKIVAQQLKDNAATTQKELLNFLQTQPEVSPNSIRPFWIANLIFVKAKPAMIATLSHRQDVAWITFNSPLKIENATIETIAPPVEPNGIEPGLEVVGAPFMWDLGYTGYGQLAFCHDTGVDPQHPAFETNYRGLFSGDEAAWFELDTSTMAAVPNGTPFDNNGHGTHVNGTMLGLDRNQNDTIGVAFNAQWIAAATISNGIGTIDQVAAFEWSLDPDGNPDTVDDIPDVINNSWYDPSIDGEDCESVYVPLLEAMEAAGIAVVFSAGNAGPGPMTITAPHNVNVNLVNSFTVGALNGNLANLPIADFSSHGPSICGGQGSLLIKPEVSAPGVSVRSARPNATYGNLSGTSMASPHVSGCILLLKEAFPELTGKELKEALYFSAIDLGTPGEDNIFGMGVVNLENAFNYLLDLGHTPVSPYRNNDLLLIDFQTGNVSCASEIVTDVLVENAGTDTLFSFKIQYEAAGISEIYTWEGTLLPSARTEFQLPPFAVPVGEQIFKVEIIEANNLPDERPFNNKLERLILVVERPLIDAFAVGNNTVCENSNALLQANYSGNGTANFQWYNAAAGGNLLGEGNFFIPENLTESTTIFADAVYLENVGEGEFDITNGVEVEAEDVGLVFDAFTDFTLKSVLIYAEESGGRQIHLRDSDGNTIESTVVFVDAGWVRANLNFDVPAGKGHVLIKGIAKTLHANTEPADFPYDIDGVCSITSGTGIFGEDVFPLYYDWEIEYQNPCVRTPIPIEVIPSEDVPNADFTVSETTIDLNIDETGEAIFTDNSTDAVAWLWNFDDGISSTEQNPIHNFTEPGTHQVSLMVTDSSGCSHSTIQEILVIFEEPTAVNSNPNDDFNILVFPNPVTDDLQISFFLNQRQSVNLTLVDAYGKVIKKEQNTNYFNENINWDLAFLHSGVYYLVFEIEDKVMVKKVVKI